MSRWTGRLPRWSRVRLRNRVALSFGLLTLAMSLVMASTLWGFAVKYVDQQRAEAARVQTAENARYIDDQLEAGRRPNAVLDGVHISPSTGVVLGVDREVYRNTTAAALALPVGWEPVAPRGVTVSSKQRIDGVDYLATTTRLSGDHGYYSELVPLTSLQRTVVESWWLLLVVALGTSILGAGTGLLASRAVLRPVEDVSRAATAIAHGDLRARLAPRGDPDLDALAATFNATVADLEARVQADARFAADVSHELRTPLTTMLNSWAVVQNRRHLLPSEVVEPLDLLGEDLQRFRTLVVDLLEISRTDEGSTATPREPVEIGELVRQAADSAAGRPVTVVEPPAAGVVLRVDKRRLERVITNLVDNAATHGGGVCEVVVGCADERVRVGVRDAGPGVPERLRRRIFERFARESSRDSQGVGLGLAIAERHVLGHGGRIWVTDSPQGGAELVVELPCGGTAA